MTGVAGALGPPAVLLVGMGSISSTKMWYTNYDWSMTMVAIAYSLQQLVARVQFLRSFRVVKALEMAEFTFSDFYGPSIIKFIQSNAEKDVELVDQLLALENHYTLYSNPGLVHLRPSPYCVPHPRPYKPHPCKWYHSCY